MIVVYVSKCVVSAALLQEYDGIYWPVTFSSRKLKSNEVNYGTVKKEVLALLRILDIWLTVLVSREFIVLMRYSTLAWLLQSSSLNGRLGIWASLLSNWNLDIRRCEKGEDEILGMLTASVTPRKDVDEVLIAIDPRKQPRQTISILPPTVEADEPVLVFIFDGSARVKNKGVAYSAIFMEVT